MQTDEILKDLRKNITEERYIHSLNVSETAERLAKRWDADSEKCRIAGLLHDCGKLKEKGKILSDCIKYRIPLSEDDLKCPQVLHAYLSEYIAFNRYGIRDKEILNAIKNHTLGSANMGITEKIVFVSDTAETGRSGGITDRVREKAYENIDQAILLIYEQTIKYNLKKGNHIHSSTLKNKIILEEKINGRT